MQDISLEQAISVLLEHTKKIEAVEEVPLLEALGRVLAEDAVATFDNPPFDRSPLDGYTFAAAARRGRRRRHRLPSRSSARSAPGISSRQKCQRARLCA